MSNPRHLAVLVLATLMLLVACSGASESGAPGATGPDPANPGGSDPALMPVTTPEEAMAALVRAEPMFASIGPQDPNLIGQAAWYTAEPASGVGAFIVTVSIGWGDCPAGCIERHEWRYAVAPDGSVRLLDERGDPVPPGGIPEGAAPAR